MEIVLIHSLTQRKEAVEQKEIVPKPQEVAKKEKQHKVTLSNRPRNQKSLADFSANQKPSEQNWWKPVLDGTITSSREVEANASEAAKAEAFSKQPENGIHCTITVDHRRQLNSSCNAEIERS